MEWATADARDVPMGDDWLGRRERQALAALDGERRRAEWRLGRWAAKQLVGSDVEVLPAPDGAPEAWCGETRLPVALSIAHRRGRALAAVAEHAVGCDLEPLRDDRDVVAFVAWEAAAKALRRGLLDAGRPSVRVDDWRFAVQWRGETVGGRWWLDGGWVLAVTAPGDIGVQM